MTISRKMNRAATITTRVVRRATPSRTQPRIQNLFVAVEKRLDYHLLDEIGAWGLLAVISLLGWLTAAIAFGIV